MPGQEKVQSNDMLLQELNSDTDSLKTQTIKLVTFMIIINFCLIFLPIFIYENHYINFNFLDYLNIIYNSFAATSMIVLLIWINRQNLDEVLDKKDSLTLCLNNFLIELLLLIKILLDFNISYYTFMHENLKTQSDILDENLVINTYEKNMLIILIVNSIKYFISFFYFKIKADNPFLQNNKRSSFIYELLILLGFSFLFNFSLIMFYLDKAVMKLILLIFENVIFLLFLYCLNNAIYYQIQEKNKFFDVINKLKEMANFLIKILEKNKNGVMYIENSFQSGLSASNSSKYLYLNTNYNSDGENVAVKKALSGKNETANNQNFFSFFKKGDKNMKNKNNNLINKFNKNNNSDVSTSNKTSLVYTTNKLLDNILRQHKLQSLIDKNFRAKNTQDQSDFINNIINNCLNFRKFNKNFSNDDFYVENLNKFFDEENKIDKENDYNQPDVQINNQNNIENLFFNKNNNNNNNMIPEQATYNKDNNEFKISQSLYPKSERSYNAGVSSSSKRNRIDSVRMVAPPHKRESLFNVNRVQNKNSNNRHFGSKNKSPPSSDQEHSNSNPKPNFEILNNNNDKNKNIKNAIDNYTHHCTNKNTNDLSEKAYCNFKADRIVKNSQNIANVNKNNCKEMTKEKTNNISPENNINSASNGNKTNEKILNYKLNIIKHKRSRSSQLTHSLSVEKSEVATRIRNFSEDVILNKNLNEKKTNSNNKKRSLEKENTKKLRKRRKSSRSNNLKLINYKYLNTKRTSKSSMSTNRRGRRKEYKNRNSESKACQNNYDRRSSESFQSSFNSVNSSGIYSRYDEASKYSSSKYYVSSFRYYAKNRNNKNNNSINHNINNHYSSDKGRTNKKNQYVEIENFDMNLVPSYNNNIKNSHDDNNNNLEKENFNNINNNKNLNDNKEKKLSQDKERDRHDDNDIYQNHYDNKDGDNKATRNIGNSIHKDFSNDDYTSKFKDNEKELLNSNNKFRLEEEKKSAINSLKNSEMNGYFISLNKGQQNLIHNKNSIGNQKNVNQIIPRNNNVYSSQSPENKIRRKKQSEIQTNRNEQLNSIKSKLDINYKPSYKTSLNKSKTMDYLKDSSHKKKMRSSNDKNYEKIISGHRRSNIGRKINYNKDNNEQYIKDDLELNIEQSKEIFNFNSNNAYSNIFNIKNNNFFINDFNLDILKIEKEHNAEASRYCFKIGFPEVYLKIKEMETKSFKEAKDNNNLEPDNSNTSNDEEKNKSRKCSDDKAQTDEFKYDNKNKKNNNLPYKEKGDFLQYRDDLNYYNANKSENVLNYHNTEQNLLKNKEKEKSLFKIINDNDNEAAILKELKKNKEKIFKLINCYQKLSDEEEIDIRIKSIFLNRLNEPSFDQRIAFEDFIFQINQICLSSSCSADDMRIGPFEVFWYHKQDIDDAENINKIHFDNNERRFFESKNVYLNSKREKEIDEVEEGKSFFINFTIKKIKNSMLLSHNFKYDAQREQTLHNMPTKKYNYSNKAIKSRGRYSKSEFNSNIYGINNIKNNNNYYNNNYFWENNSFEMNSRGDDIQKNNYFKSNSNLNINDNNIQNINNSRKYNTELLDSNLMAYENSIYNSNYNGYNGYNGHNARGNNHNNDNKDFIFDFVENYGNRNSGGSLTNKNAQKNNKKDEQDDKEANKIQSTGIFIVLEKIENIHNFIFNSFVMPELLLLNQSSMNKNINSQLKNLKESRIFDRMRSRKSIGYLTKHFISSSDLIADLRQLKTKNFKAVKEAAQRERETEEIKPNFTNKNSKIQAYGIKRNTGNSNNLMSHIKSITTNNNNQNNNINNNDLDFYRKSTKIYENDFNKNTIFNINSNSNNNINNIYSRNTIENYNHNKNINNNNYNNYPHNQYVNSNINNNLKFSPEGLMPNIKSPSIYPEEQTNTYFNEMENFYLKSNRNYDTQTRNFTTTFIFDNNVISHSPISNNITYNKNNNTNNIIKNISSNNNNYYSSANNERGSNTNNIFKNTINYNNYNNINYFNINTQNVKTLDSNNFINRKVENSLLYNNNINNHNHNYNNFKFPNNVSSNIRSQYNQTNTPSLVSNINTSFVSEKLSALLHDFKHVVYDNIIYFDYLIGKYLNPIIKQSQKLLKNTIVLGNKAKKDEELEKEHLSHILDISRIIDQEKINDELEYLNVMKEYTISLVLNITNFISENEFLSDTNEHVDLIKIINIMVKIFNRRLEFENNENVLNNGFINFHKEELKDAKASKKFKNISIRSIIHDPENPIYKKIISNQSLIISLFYNIVSNSFKYTQQGEIVIETNFDSFNNTNTLINNQNSNNNNKNKINNKNLIVKISDTGIGIPDEILKNWGKPFNFKDKTKGTGLGQFLIDTISKKLGFNMFRPEKNLNSAHKSGTIIKFHIPININNNQQNENNYFDSKPTSLGNKLIHLNSKSFNNQGRRKSCLNPIINNVVTNNSGLKAYSNSNNNISFTKKAYGKALTSKSTFYNFNKSTILFTNPINLDRNNISSIMKFGQPGKFKDCHSPDNMPGSYLISNNNNYPQVSRRKNFNNDYDSSNNNYVNKNNYMNNNNQNINFRDKMIYVICLDDDQLFLSMLNTNLIKFANEMYNFKFEFIFVTNFKDFFVEYVKLLSKNIIIDFFIFDENISSNLKGSDISLIVQYIYKLYLKENYELFNYEFLFVTEDMRLLKNRNRAFKSGIINKENIFSKMQLKEICARIKEIIFNIQF